MRFLIIFLSACFFCTPSASFADETSFDSFIKSREVVATLYFQANSDVLSKGEREQIEKTVLQLRTLQKDGRMIRVEGFSSPEGDQETNFKLSFFRARTVADLIEAEGLQAEVALTGYGDLHAGAVEPARERRVEIASYIKPLGLKKVKVAKEKQKSLPLLSESLSQISPPAEFVIDALAIEQAIMEKIGSPPTSTIGSVSQVDAVY